MPEESDYALPIGSLTVNKYLAIEAVDDAFVRLFECSADTLVGQPIDTVFSSRERKGSVAFYRGMSAYESGWIDVYAGLCISGRDFYARLRATKDIATGGWRLFVEEARVGSPDYLLIVGLNRLKSVFVSANDGVVFLNANNEIIEHNPRFFDLMNFRSAHNVALNEQAIHGRNFFETVGGRAFAPVLAALKSPKPRRRIYQGEVRHGDKLLAVRVSPTLLPIYGFVGSCLVIRDLTTDKELERTRLDRARIAGMAEVAVGVMHNVGNALNSVHVSISVLRKVTMKQRVEGLRQALGLFHEQDDLGPFLTEHTKGKRLLPYMDKVCTSLETSRSNLLGELDDLDRFVEHATTLLASYQVHAVRTAVLDDCDLGALLRDSIKMTVESEMSYDIEIERDYPDTMPTLYIDRHRLLQILLNLLSNATHALVASEGRHRRVQIRVRQHEDLCTIAVTDNGVGIAESDFNRIFNHGFTTKPDGHGFGLHSCSLLATELGGELTFTSDGPDTGATFTIIFPVRGVSDDT